MARSKMKSHRGLAKRFKVTKNGKVIGMKGGYHHKNEKKRSKRVRQARSGLQVLGAMRKRYRQLLPHSS